MKWHIHEMETIVEVDQEFTFSLKPALASFDLDSRFKYRDVLLHATKISALPPQFSDDSKYELLQFHSGQMMLLISKYDHRPQYAFVDDKIEIRLVGGQNRVLH